MVDKKLKAILLGTLLVCGAGGRVPQKIEKPEKEEKIENEIIKPATADKFADFKSRMQKLTPQIMLETILTEGVKLDADGRCKPYQDSKGIWTIGFGMIRLDGKPVTENTRHITVQEAWEKSIDFYENKSVYFFMWCYEIGIEGLHIDTDGKAFCLASIIYNTGTKIIEDKTNKSHLNRNEALRKLYKEYGDDVTADQVQAVFAKYPIEQLTTFGKVIDGGTPEDWANTLGIFTAEGGGIYWRRWLEGQMAMGNIAPKDLLDLPSDCMYDFWRCVGAQKSALFTSDPNGRCQVNPDAFVKFNEWAQNPVTSQGYKIVRKTSRQVLNNIDPLIVARMEVNKFGLPKNTIGFADAQRLYTADGQKNFFRLVAQNGGYESASRALQVMFNKAKQKNC